MLSLGTAATAALFALAVAWGTGATIPIARGAVTPALVRLLTIVVVVLAALSAR